MISNRTILISINTSWNIYHFRAGLLNILRKQGYRVLSAAPEDVYTPRLRTMVDGHFAVPMQNAGTSPFYDFWLFCRYVALLRRVKPVVMLTYTIKPNIYGALAARLLGIPVIANVSGLGTAFIRDSWITRVAKLLYRFAFSGVQHVFFQNPEDRDLFVNMKLVAAEKTVLLPGSGVDLVHFSPRPQRTRTGAIGFVLIARLLWDKGIGEFVDAARIVKRIQPDAQFHLVGPKGVDNQTAITDDVLEQWVAEGVISYLGQQDDVRDIMAQHDCVVLPSYREGMSRVLLEAAAMGKPMITTDVPGCRQIVVHEQNGFLCAPQNAQSLADAMLRFIALSPEARLTMGAQSRQKAEREFDERIVFDTYLRTIARYFG